MSGSAVPAPTKVTRPLGSGIFPRARLYGLLDQLRDKPALWICGPPAQAKPFLRPIYS